MSELTLERKIELINEEVERKNQEATQLLDYLNVQRNKAKILEEEEEENLKRKGIVIGQHIPSLKSKLQLDPDKLSEFGDFSSTLLIARDLVDQNKTNFLRRTGNLPISDIVEAKKLKNDENVLNTEPDMPHYLSKTNNTNIRNDRVTVRFAETLHTRELERSMALEASASVNSGEQLLKKSKFKKKVMLSAIQREENDNILKGINHKLNYLRNPRNDPTAINKMLNKPKSHFSEEYKEKEAAAAQQKRDDTSLASQHSHQQGSVQNSVNNYSAQSKVNQNGSVMMQSSVGGGGSLNSHSLSPSQENHGESAGNKKKKYGNKPQAVTDNPLFVSEPSLINFTNYEVGRKYTQPMSFRNISAVTRTVRILPPANRVFSTAPLKYPTNSVGGMVAPGMCVTTTLTFLPTSLGDFSDFLRVETESGGFKVQIHAQREPPYLSIPSTLNVGNCLVGDASRVTINCLNTGGAGKFTLCTEQQYLNERTADPDFVAPNYGTLGCMRMAPFTLYPTEFSLLRNEAAQLNIEFVPLSVDVFECTMYMKCDNGQVRQFTVRGESKVLDVTLAEVNAVQYDSGDSRQYSDIIFPATYVDNEAPPQSVMVVNDTGLAVEYEWVWMHMDITAQDRHKTGQNAIHMREAESIAEHNAMMGESIDALVGTHRNTEGGSLYETGEQVVLDDLPLPHPPRSGGGNHLSLSIPVDPKAQKSMARSMKMTMMDMTGTEQMNSSNRAVSNQFEIFPARGVLPNDGAETFTVSFTPSDLATAKLRAVMMIKSVPRAALPTDAKQSEYLQVLADNGHGEYTRLRSWLEEIGSLAPVEEFTCSNGDQSKEAKLISLHSLLHMVLSQARRANSQQEETFLGVPVSIVQESEYDRINVWVRKMLAHLYNFRKAAAMDDASSVESEGESSDVEESIAGSLVSESGQHHHRHHRDVTVVELFDWQLDESAKGENNAPVLMYPIKLDHDLSKYSTVDRVTGEVSTAPPPPIDDFSAEDQGLLHEVWLDVKHSLLLLGRDICELLNNKVNHEAVDFLKDCTLNHVAGLSFGVFGEGAVQNIGVNPPQLEVGGQLSIGKEWKGTFKLVNNTNSMAEIDIDTKQCSIAKCVSALNIIPEDPSASFSLPAREPVFDLLMESGLEEKFRVAMDVNRILLMPHSEQEITVTLAVNMLGRYEITVPFHCKSQFTVIDSITMVADVIGPRLRFDVAEVDMGLVGVGGDTSKTLCFTNESDVSLMFMMKPSLHVDTSVAAGAVGSKKVASVDGSNSARGGSISHRSAQNSHRSGLSRQSTARSDDFSVMDSLASGNSEFKIELKNAVVTIDPPSGVVGPLQSFSVTINCKAGKVGQRIRGLIESRIFDSSGKVEILSHYMNMRGEVQAPKTVMYPLQHNLGVVYVGMPVTFVVYIENICNLPTKYKLLRPGGESSLYRLTFDQDRGPLGAKEKKTITCTFTALTTGVIDDVISNKIFGAPLPLGFSVKAHAKGISLEFLNLKDSDPVPAPLADPESTQFPSGESTEPLKPPEPKEIEPIILGDEVQLYERKFARFVIRNMSGIPAPYALRAKKFTVGEKPRKMGESVASVSTVETRNSVLAVPERSDLILGVHETGANKFQSEAGKSYVSASLQRQEDRKFLYSGLGASYLVENRAGVIPPWGVQEVFVRAFNDIPGCYNDEIECALTEGDITRLFNLPIKLNIVGCPIVIEKDTVGMTSVAREPAQFIGKQLLQMGHACVDCEPLVREFYVRNNGSKKGRVRWQVKGLATKTNGPVKLSLQVDEQGRVKSVFQFWEDIAKDSPFKVEPESAVVPPYGKHKFKVTLFRTNALGKELAELTGSVLFSDEVPAVLAGVQGLPDDRVSNGMMDRKMSTNSVSSMVSKQSVGSIKGAANASINKFTLSMLLEGDFVYPTIVMDKNELVASETQTVVPEVHAVVLKSQSTLLFGSRDAKPRELCNRAITVVNPLDAQLVFNVSTEGPFVLQDSNDDAQFSSAHAVVSKRDLLNVASSGASVTSVATQNTSKTSIGRTFSLLPNKSGSFAVAFHPKRDVKERLIASFGSDAGKPSELRGKVIFSYATGQSLHVPIVAKISTPFISGSTPRLYYGCCHVSQHCSGIFLIANPTDVPAVWTVEHVPGGGAWKKSTAIRVRGFEDKVTEIDDPSVFYITPDSGRVNGPTVSVTAAVAAPPKDFSRKVETIVPQRLVQSSWATHTMTMADSLVAKHNTSDQHSSEAEARYPMPITIKFTPSKNVHYCSRFRFACEFGNSFEVVLQGEGTYEEHEHKPVNPIPK